MTESTEPTERTARCACGAGSITVAGDPRLNGVCHCTNCKQRTGSAFGISCYFPRSAVTRRHGPTSVYAFHHAAQKHDQERHFCPSCGTTLFWYVSTLPDLIGIAGGCFGESDLPAPSASYTHAKKYPWVTLPEGWLIHER
jgi:hypothetical protein